MRPNSDLDVTVRRTLVDFGQNLVGWVRLRASGVAGRIVTVRHAEVLEHDELGTRPLRSGGGHRPLHPERRRRRVRADADVPRLPLRRGRRATRATLTADGPRGRRRALRPAPDRHVRMLRPDAQPAARERRVVPAGQLPRRADRLPAARRATRAGPATSGRVRADRRVSSTTSAASWTTGWRDLAAEQANAGGRGPVRHPGQPQVRPAAPADFPAAESTAVWADAAVWVPWALWEAYGDRDALRRHYPPMAAHVRHVEGLLSPNGLWDTGFPVRRLARPDRPAGGSVRGQGRQGRRRHRVPSTGRIDLAATAAARARRHRPTPPSFDALATTVQHAFHEHYVQRRRNRPERLPHGVRPGDRVRPPRRGVASSWRATGSPSWPRRPASPSRPASPAPRTSWTR